MNHSHVANSDYTVIDRAPLALETGDKVRVGQKDTEWPGWIWVTTIDGRGSYVPEDVISPNPDGTANTIRPFQARDLSVKKGDTVTSLHEVKGWHWCRAASGEEGWLPAFLLKQAE
jgi:hypothetical protein